MFKQFSFLALSLFSLLLLGQETPVKLEPSQQLLEYYHYDTDLLSKEFHQKRREALRAIMPEGSAMVIFAAPQRNRSNDVYYEYHQNPDFYYLTGLREPHALIIIYKDSLKINGEKTNEVVFVQDRDERREVWDGRRLGKEGAEASLGIQTVAINKDFNAKAYLGSKKIKRKLYQLPEAIEAGKDQGSLDQLVATFGQEVTIEGDPQEYAKSLMATLRQDKQPEEMVLMRKAIEITCEAQNELMRALKPGMAEYQTEAVVEYVFKKNGSEYTGFPSIHGGGENSCILHYTSNRKPLSGGDLLISDIGAEYHGYTADVTRTLPTDGKFSTEEKLIYELVLKAQSAGIAVAIDGNSFRAPHDTATKIIAAGLIELGIIKKASEVRKYFMHGTSHYLGLDVHDAGLYGPLEVNQVITVEPGIYIAEGSDCDPKWWNIGVRIEDDILITDGEAENLSASAPRTVAEIEALMEEESSFGD